MHLAEIITTSCSEFCRRLYCDLLPTDSPGNRITSAASTRRNLELRNTETCGKYRRDINQDLLETFFFSSLFHIRHWWQQSIVTIAVCLAKQPRIRTYHLVIVHFLRYRRNNLKFENATTRLAEFSQHYDNTWPKFSFALHLNGIFFR